MRNCFLIVLSALLLSGNHSLGQPVSFDPEIRAYYLNLDTVKGNQLLKDRYVPGNPDFVRLIAYRDFLFALLHQSKSHADGFNSRSDRWISRLQKSHQSLETTPAAIAEIHLYRAVLAWQNSDFKFSASELLASYRVVAKYGADMAISDRDKLSGILGVLFQMVPVQYEKYLGLLGVRISGLSGYNGLERYYSAAIPGTVQRTEGFLLLVTAYKEFRKDPVAAWKFVKDSGEPMGGNALVRYQCALAALKAGDCESAVGLLDPVSNSEAVNAIPYWNYQLGRCKLYQNSEDAFVYLDRFAGNPGGDNYLHRALLMTSWYYSIHGQNERAKAYLLRIKSLPEPVTMYDRQAFSEANSTQLPDTGLLKARLLYDGGYFKRCLELCGHLGRSVRYNDRDAGELYYRKARCEQRLELDSAAIADYLGVVQKAEAIDSYIVPNSALQLGNLYKKAGQVELARKYYQICLDLNKYGYRDGLNRQVQEALRELGK